MKAEKWLAECRRELEQIVSAAAENRAASASMAANTAGAKADLAGVHLGIEEMKPQLLTTSAGVQDRYRDLHRDLDFHAARVAASEEASAEIEGEADRIAAAQLAAEQRLDAARVLVEIETRLVPADIETARALAVANSCLIKSTRLRDEMRFYSNGRELGYLRQAVPQELRRFIKEMAPSTPIDDDFETNPRRRRPPGCGNILVGARGAMVRRPLRPPRCIHDRINDVRTSQHDRRRQSNGCFQGVAG